MWCMTKCCSIARMKISLFSNLRGTRSDCLLLTYFYFKHVFYKYSWDRVSQSKCTKTTLMQLVPKSASMCKYATRWEVGRSEQHFHTNIATYRTLEITSCILAVDDYTCITCCWKTTSVPRCHGGQRGLPRCPSCMCRFWCHTSFACLLKFHTYFPFPNLFTSLLRYFFEKRPTPVQGRMS